jgi:DNA-binding CsgD family transcriptional regulator/PAS domain-containing protein
MYSAAQLELLVESVYEASIDGGGWTRFLSQLALQLGGVLPTLFIHDVRAEGPLAIHVGEGAVHAYQGHSPEKNRWLLSGAHLLPSGTVRTSHMMRSCRTFLSSEWCADYCRPLNVSQGIGATIHQDSKVTSNVAIFAGTNRADFGAEDIALLKALMPHMQRALKIYMHMAGADSRQREFADTMEALSVGVILVNKDARVLFANRFARRLLETHDGLSLDRDAVRAIRSSETTTLRHLIGCASASNGKRSLQSGGGLNVTRPNGQRSLQVLVSPIRPQQRLHLSERAVAAIYVTDPDQVAQKPEVILMRLYGLTPSEAKVAALIVRGTTARHVSSNLNVSYNTVKSHLKRVFAKTGTKGQGDLIRLIVGRAAQIGSIAEVR